MQNSLDGVITVSGWQMYVDEFMDNPQAAPCPQSYDVTSQAVDVTAESNDHVQSTDATPPEVTSDAGNTVEVNIEKVAGHYWPGLASYNNLMTLGLHFL